MIAVHWRFPGSERAGCVKVGRNGLPRHPMYCLASNTGGPVSRCSILPWAAANSSPWRDRARWKASANCWRPREPLGGEARAFCAEARSSHAVLRMHSKVWAWKA